MGLSRMKSVEDASGGNMTENSEKKFKEKYLAGEIEFEEIDDYSQ